METKYVVNESTLTEIADAIRSQENSTDKIPMEDFAKHVGAIEPAVEEYMRITDYLEYPALLEESYYTQEEITRCATLYKFYLEMEDIT